jgi:hypothetical protein
MAKKNAGDEGEQMELIELTPKNHKEIIKIARAYKRCQAARTEALAEEVKYKERLLAEVKEAEIAANPDGGYKFKCDGAIITVTPRDELVRVKFADDDGAKA